MGETMTHEFHIWPSVHPFVEYTLDWRLWELGFEFTLGWINRHDETEWAVTIYTGPLSFSAGFVRPSAHAGDSK